MEIECDMGSRSTSSATTAVAEMKIVGRYLAGLLASVVLMCGCARRDADRTIDDLLSSPKGMCGFFREAIELGDAALPALQHQSGNFTELQADELSRAADLVSCIESERGKAVVLELAGRPELTARVLGTVALSRRGTPVEKERIDWAVRLAEGRFEPAEERYIVMSVGSASGRSSGAIETIRDLAREVVSRQQVIHKGTAGEPWTCPCAVRNAAR